MASVGALARAGQAGLSATLHRVTGSGPPLPLFLCVPVVVCVLCTHSRPGRAMKLTDHILSLVTGQFTAAQIAREVGTTERYVRQFLSRRGLSDQIAADPTKDQSKVRRGSSIWDRVPGLIEDLKKFSLERMSASLVAGKLNSKYGTKISRNAVIGKQTRLGLARAHSQGAKADRVNRGLALPSSGHPRTPRTETAPAKPSTGSPKAPRPSTQKILAAEPYTVRTDIPPAVARKSLAQLGEDECKWPVGHVGEPGFGFCALPRVPGLPYCADCCQRAYKVPVSKIPAQAPSEERVPA